MNRDPLGSQFLNDLLGATEIGPRNWDDGAGFLLRSPDAGRTWTRLPMPAGATSARTYPLIIDEQRMLIADDGLAISTDAGGTWTRIVDGFPAPYRGWPFIGAAQFAVVAGPNLVLGGEDGLFVRPRAGGPWKSAPPPLPPGVRFPAPQAVTAVVRGDAVYAAVVGRLYRSDDDGQTWIDLTGGVPIGAQKPPIDLLAARGRNVLIATAGDKRTLLLSRDRGASWQRLDDGLPPNRVTALAATDAGFLAGTMGAGIWRHK